MFRFKFVQIMNPGGTCKMSPHLGKGAKFTKKQLEQKGLNVEKIKNLFMEDLLILIFQVFCI